MKNRQVPEVKINHYMLHSLLTRSELNYYYSMIALGLGDQMFTVEMIILCGSYSEQQDQVETGNVNRQK